MSSDFARRFGIQQNPAPRGGLRVLRETFRVILSAGGLNDGAYEELENGLHWRFDRQKTHALNGLLHQLQCVAEEYGMDYTQTLDGDRVDVRISPAIASERSRAR
jgi:hypothetical protein